MRVPQEKHNAVFIFVVVRLRIQSSQLTRLPYMNQVDRFSPKVSTLSMAQITNLNNTLSIYTISLERDNALQSGTFLGIAYLRRGTYSGYLWTVIVHSTLRQLIIGVSQLCRLTSRCGRVMSQLCCLCFFLLHVLAGSVDRNKTIS